MSERPNHRPEVYTLGHRSALGLAVNPATGEMWLNENGPNGGDEINILKPGANYGWPIVSYGRQYTGPWQSEIPGHAGFEPPLVFWVPSIAASGMAFYTGDKFPKWKGDVFVGACAPGKFRVLAISSGSSSTRRWRNCAVNRCSSSCGSGFARSVRVRTGCCTC